MRTTTVARIAERIGARLEGDGTAEVGPDVVIDTRRATSGSLFIALPGERVDGHDFTEAARVAGSRAVMATRPTDADLPHLLVDDTREGLPALARVVVARERDRGMVTVALTGSSGKTSTKDLLAQVLEDHGPTVSPVGSFNNEIGVPLTACGVDEHTDFLVSEMGARGKGHIAWLTSIVPPDVAMVLNIGTAHLGEFGSREAIAEAKGEIVEALGPDGWAVLNAADERVAGMAPRTRAHLAWFSPDADHRHPEADIEVWAGDVVADDLDRHSFTLHARVDGTTCEHPVSLRTLGAHQVANAVAAAAAALAALTSATGHRPDPAAVAASLSSATTRSPMRMELHERADGLVVVSDCYNANPDSMAASLAALGNILGRRRAADPHTRGVAVLGDMLELGPDAPALHREVGALAARSGFDLVLAVGEHAGDLAAGARAGGAESRVVTVEEAARSIGWTSHDVLLVKASRALALERVAEQVLDLGGPSAAGLDFDGRPAVGEHEEARK
ncbi:UDP-N-acetylmuramoyl-tripeptide--D-alanyl-D-alanine ligase [Acidipropionibacterium timonense]|uniref:UDP-N-acetylmuramoyl-tripeptide--D-alanyl-D- alanine ligase n=1 Tax=Acidipropionibacterium timonense TaxID=2161818 RepID=UPI0010301D3A|nr:UDP-N-acetylmuramoyl-tripeptide--D-alanyl-D-alanine ligase [Acidipropionibacterium timonense]